MHVVSVCLYLYIYIYTHDFQKIHISLDFRSWTSRWEPMLDASKNGPSRWDWLILVGSMVGFLSGSWCLRCREIDLLKSHGNIFFVPKDETATLRDLSSQIRGSGCTCHRPTLWNITPSRRKDMIRYSWQQAAEKTSGQGLKVSFWWRIRVFTSVHIISISFSWFDLKERWLMNDTVRSLSGLKPQNLAICI